MLLGDQVSLRWSSFALVFSQIVQQFSRISKDFHLDGTLIVNNAGSSVSLAAIYNDYYKGYNYVTDPLPMKHDKKRFLSLTTSGLMRIINFFSIDMWPWLHYEAV